MKYKCFTEVAKARGMFNEKLKTVCCTEFYQHGKTKTAEVCKEKMTDVSIFSGITVGLVGTENVRINSLPIVSGTVQYSVRACMCVETKDAKLAISVSDSS